LQRADHAVVVVDDLSSGHRDAVPSGVPFVHADVRDAAAVGRALEEHHVEAVFHFASRIQVGESVRDPRLYYRDNLAAGIALLETLLDHEVRAFVLSSTAAVYGDPRYLPIDEAHPTAPVNPYGATKLALEWVLASYSAAYGLKYAALRYFNASGAGDGLSERHDPETHLIPLVLDAAMGARPSLTVFGDDYDTPDGTCVRDYIHVADLARAHLLALAACAGGQHQVYNLGSGSGFSNREVLAACRDVTGRDIPATMAPRRPGDPAVLVASSARIRASLGWRPARSLTDMVADAWTFTQARAGSR
jgi:UDP-glucose 4-epimerase